MPVPLMAWFTRFVDPIELPDGRELLTLRDAAEYITALPKAEHDAADWQVAMEVLLHGQPPGPASRSGWQQFALASAGFGRTILDVPGGRGLAVSVARGCPASVSALMVLKRRT